MIVPSLVWARTTQHHRLWASCLIHVSRQTLHSPSPLSIDDAAAVAAGRGASSRLLLALIIDSGRLLHGVGSVWSTKKDTFTAACAAHQVPIKPPAGGRVPANSAMVRSRPTCLCAVVLLALVCGVWPQGDTRVAVVTGANRGLGVHDLRAHPVRLAAPDFWRVWNAQASVLHARLLSLGHITSCSAADLWPSAT